MLQLMVKTKLPECLSLYGKRGLKMVGNNNNFP